MINTDVNFIPAPSGPGTQPLRNLSVPWNHPVFHLSSFVANSFCDLVQPTESHSRKNIRKNTVGPNKFTDFENFGFEHPGQFKTMFFVNLAETPRYR